MLEVTVLAAEKIREVLEGEGQLDAPLRVMAIPNGSGGVQFGLTMESDGESDDVAIDKDGLKFLIDEDSAPYLEKATIDFVEEMARVGFTITNPDFPAAGGCGSGCACGSGGGGGCGSGGCGGH